MDKRNAARVSGALGSALLVAGMGGLTGCDVGREFRAAATPAFQSGVTQIVNGLMDGFFAAIEVDAPTESDGS